jgi:hypothetical protein
MIKNLSIFVLVILLTVALQAQDKRVAQKAGILVDTQEMVSSSGYSYEPNSVTQANYVLVDSMANIYGPAISTLNPLAYDPWADVVAFIHRGHAAYAAGSGQLWYQVSTDKGTTWSRVGPINTAPIAGRYPSMAISNPTRGDISGTTALFSWPELNPGAFGNVGYGADQPVGTGSAFADTVVGNYSSQVPSWASDENDWMFWSSDNQTDAAIEIWRTQDFGTIESSIIPSSTMEDGGNITFGGVTFGNNVYLGVFATFPDPDPTNPIQFGWYPGYFTSTDNGATWDNGTVVDFRTISALSAYDQILDYAEAAGTIRFDGDLNIDKNGNLHFAIGVTDTNTTPWTHTLVDIFQTSTGWDATIIADIEGDPFTTWADANSPGLGQMGYSLYLAFDENREVMAAQWSDKGNTDLADVFFAYKKLEDTDWSTKENLTATDQMNETQSHMGNRLAKDGNNYTAFSMYGYQTGYTGPSPDPVASSGIYIAPVPFTVIVDVDDDYTVNSFELEQNYPNPFNPKTSIRYSVAERSNVTLKVFDMLGREVSTLVNRTQEAGSYSVSFDASKLSSGMYLYTITAGNYNATKKMVLMK